MSMSRFLYFISRVGPVFVPARLYPRCRLSQAGCEYEAVITVKGLAGQAKCGQIAQLDCARDT
jgi:hypothetical protein